MEKAKLAAEDATRRLSSSSSSNSSEVFQDDPPSIESGFNSTNQDNSQNEDVQGKAVSLSEDVFELGAEGTAINYIYQIP